MSNIIDFRTRKPRPPIVAVGYDPHARQYLTALRGLVDAMIELDEVARRADALIESIDLRPSDSEPPAA